MKKKYFIEIAKETYGEITSHWIECPVASESVLKRMWKHYLRIYRRMKNFNVYALMEDEDGCILDLSMDWCYQEMEHAAMAGVIPFCC